MEMEFRMFFFFFRCLSLFSDSMLRLIRLLLVGVLGIWIKEWS
jgi:hypothetical protein